MVKPDAITITCITIKRSITKMNEARKDRAISLDGRKSLFSLSHKIQSVEITTTTTKDVTTTMIQKRMMRL